jgi:hypothetical protein
MLDAPTGHCACMALLARHIQRRGTLKCKERATGDCLAQVLETVIHVDGPLGSRVVGCCIGDIVCRLEILNPDYVLGLR